MAYFEFRTNPMYVQGPDALLELKRYSYHLGNRFLIVTGCGPITDQVLEKVNRSFSEPMAANVCKDNLKYAWSLKTAEEFDRENKKITYEIHDFEGQEVTYANIDRLTEIAKKMDANVIVGIGGGKVLDLVRGVYHKIPCEVVLCPTAAATNAPAGTLTVIYDDNHDVVGSIRMNYHPAVVITDTKLMIQSPSITLAAGMGDCMGTFYEGLITIEELNRRRQVVDVAWHSTLLARQIYYEKGYQAMVASKNKTITPAYESVISQIVHTSGPMSVTVSIHMPHIIDELLLEFPKTKPMPHGILVGYGVIPFIVWANYPLDELYEYVDFCVSVGIPTTLKELGIENEPVEKFIAAAEKVVNGPTIGMTPAKLTAEDLYKSMFVANDIVKDYLE